MRIAGRWWGVALCVIVAGATPADESLPRSRAAAQALEARDALPLTDFYDPPWPLPNAAPGALIRAQRFNGYQLPPGAAAIRILYHSLALNGTDVAVSGVVLVPAGTAPPDGWPLIAWAHGTSGVARSCAPSLMKDVEYGEEGLMPMVAAGFAVVATDYAGLGTPTAHQYDNKRAQANDVVYSVIAAHAALADLGASWVAVGHSQGGVAVWGVAELEAARHDAGYAGAISVAGDMSFEAFEAHDAETFNAVTDLYWPLTAFGIHASYPSFDVRRMLTAPVLARYRDVTTQGCWYYAYAALAEIGTRRAVQPGWDLAPEVRKYNDDNRSANRPIQGPLLVLAGDDDRSVAIANIEAGVRQACSLGLPIEFVHRPGLDHDPLMEQTTPLQLDWVRDRLAGKPWSSNCAAATLHPPAPPPKVLDALIGEYGVGDDLMAIYEADGRLHADGRMLHQIALDPTGPNRYVTGQLVDGHVVRFVFHRDASGYYDSVSVDGVVQPRRDVGAEAIRAIRSSLEADPAALRAAALDRSPPAETEPKLPLDLVALSTVDPSIKFDIRYASANNFMGFPLYDQPGAFLERPAAAALGRVAAALRARGYGLLVFDAYRPWFVTKMFWEATPPKSRIFVADPANGSRHNRGCAVDLTLYDLATGEPEDMTSRYDEFSRRAYPNYVGGTSRQRWLRELLREAMEKEEFTVYPEEWWHFDFVGWQNYPIGNVPFSNVTDGTTQPQKQDQQAIGEAAARPPD